LNRNGRDVERTAGAQGTSCASPDYVYDGDGQRVKKSSGMLYFTGTGSAPLLETSLDGLTTISEYVFFNGKRLARIDQLQGSPHYYVTDHLGSTAKVTNRDGTIIEETNELGAFGEPISGGNGHYVFTGKERDTGGEDYFGGRYYAFRAGRFLTPDWSATPQVVPYASFGAPQTLNLYSYVQNRSVVLTDPDGHTVELGQNPIMGADLLTRSLSTAEQGLFKTTSNAKTKKMTLEFDEQKAKSFNGKHTKAFEKLAEMCRNTDKTVVVHVAEAFRDPSGKTHNVSAEYGGGVTIADGKNRWQVLVSPSGAPDQGQVPGKIPGTSVNDPLDIIMAHEVMGHAYQNWHGLPTDERTVKGKENEFRKEHTPALPERDEE
jgi:RHS repeat-associated protein